MTMSSKHICAIALLAALAGCASKTQLDRQFGLTARDTLRQQIINPVPPASPTVPVLDGQAAKSAYDNYQKSFKDPVPQTGALAIGVGR